MPSKNPHRVSRRVRVPARRCAAAELRQRIRSRSPALAIAKAATHRDLARPHPPPCPKKPARRRRRGFLESARSEARARRSVRSQVARSCECIMQLDPMLEALRRAMQPRTSRFGPLRRTMAAQDNSFRRIVRPRDGPLLRARAVARRAGRAAGGAARGGAKLRNVGGVLVTPRGARDASERAPSVRRGVTAWSSTCSRRSAAARPERRERRAGRDRLHVTCRGRGRSPAAGAVAPPADQTTCSRS